jgi:hypothetical protein
MSSKLSNIGSYLKGFKGKVVNLEKTFSMPYCKLQLKVIDPFIEHFNDHIRLKI